MNKINDFNEREIVRLNNEVRRLIAENERLKLLLDVKEIDYKPELVDFKKLLGNIG